MYDVAVIGCGVVGAACAYTLSKYDLSVLILERENDIATGATRANSAIIHAGYDPRPGTLMAKLNVLGAAMAKEICRDLNVPYIQNGAMVLNFSEEGHAHLQKLYQQGVENGVEQLRIVSGDEARTLEPELSPEVKSALVVPTSAIVNPWEYAIAMAEIAVANGAKLELEAEVESVSEAEGFYELHTGRGVFESRFVISACGVDCDKLHDCVAPHDYNVMPTKGEYLLLDKAEGNRVKNTIFRLPDEKGKGVLVMPTVHGNLLVGPNAVLCEDAHHVDTTAEGLEFVRRSASYSVPGIDYSATIRNFAGMRANTDREDFIIRTVKPRFAEAAGIRSPGLSAAPAIALEVLELLKNEGLVLNEKDKWIGRRNKKWVNHMTKEQLKQAIEENPLYGRVICRCETVTEGEIVDALHSPIPPISVDGVKRRTGSSMGRCQGGFCVPRIVEIMARELGVDRLDIIKDIGHGAVLTGHTVEVSEDV